MSLRGVWQLQKLIVSFCDWGGSSRGISNVKEHGEECTKGMAFMESHLPAFREKNPQLESSVSIAASVREELCSHLSVLEDLQCSKICHQKLAEDIIMRA
ncbi:hypothetical protein Sango_0764000 [Sesamum angolense]|uniref:Uncharacterized protein n=1 Tax=Sesamum angolense TaxID=2727404 RepID=A0AAE2BZY1_9LAMI|nr:hypothetical protein Sango_0764000 [Sesamum angolense]